MGHSYRNYFLFVLSALLFQLGCASTNISDEEKHPVDQVVRVVFFFVEGADQNVFEKASMPQVEDMSQKGYTTSIKTMGFGSPASLLAQFFTSKTMSTVPKSVPSPSILSLAKENKLRTGIISSDEGIRSFFPKDQITEFVVSPYKEDDHATEAIKLFYRTDVDIYIVHFKSPLMMANKYGWGSKKHVQSLELVDRAISRFNGRLLLDGHYDSTAFFAMMAPGDLKKKSKLKVTNSPFTFYIPNLDKSANNQFGVVDAAPTITQLLRMKVPQGVQWEGQSWVAQLKANANE